MVYRGDDRSLQHHRCAGLRPHPLCRLAARHWTQGVHRGTSTVQHLTLADRSALHAQHTHCVDNRHALTHCIALHCRPATAAPRLHCRPTTALPPHHSTCAERDDVDGPVNLKFLYHAPFFQNGKQSGFEMCFGPSTLGDGAWVMGLGAGAWVLGPKHVSNPE